MERRLFVLERIVHAFGVVPDIPAIQSNIEGRNIEQELPPVVVCVLVLDGAVESFAMSVLFRRTRTSLVVREMER